MVRVCAILNHLVVPFRVLLMLCTMVKHWFVSCHTPAGVQRIETLCWRRLRLINMQLKGTSVTVCVIDARVGFWSEKGSSWGEVIMNHNLLVLDG